MTPISLQQKPSILSPYLPVLAVLAGSALFNDNLGKSYLSYTRCLPGTGLCYLWLLPHGYGASFYKWRPRIWHKWHQLSPPTTDSWHCTIPHPLGCLMYLTEVHEVFADSIILTPISLQFAGYMHAKLRGWQRLALWSLASWICSSFPGTSLTGLSVKSQVSLAYRFWAPILETHSLLCHHRATTSMLLSILKS